LKGDLAASGSWNTGALLVAVAALPMLQAVLITPIMPVIRDANGAQAFATFHLRVVLATPALAIVLLLPLIGRFADRVQRRQLLIFGLVLYALCGAAVYASPHLETMFVSRLFLGVALACLMTATTALTGDLFDGAERNRLLGFQSAGTTIVGMCVPVLAGLVALTEWRVNFLFYLVALLLVVPAMRLPGRTGVIPASIELANFRVRSVLGILALMGFGTMTLWLVTIQLAFHLAEIGYSSPVVAGLALGTPCLSGVVLGVSYKSIKQRFSFGAIASLTFVLIAVGYSVIAAATNLPLLVFGLLLAGCGFGLNPPNCAGWLLTVVPAETRARAAASLTFAICAGQLTAPFVYQPMVAIAGSAASFSLMAASCLAVAATVLVARDVPMGRHVTG
jgi:MFS family permease